MAAKTFPMSMSTSAFSVATLSSEQIISFLPSNFEIKFVHLQLFNGIEFKLNCVVNANAKP